MKRLRYFLFGIIIGAFFRLPAPAAAEVTLVSSNRNKIYLLINEGIRQSLKSEATDVYLSDTPEIDPDFNRKTNLVVTVGNAATIWAKDHISNIPLAASGVILMSDRRKLQDTIGVRLDFPMVAYLRLVADYLPNVKSVGLIHDDALDETNVKNIQTQAEDFGLQAVTVPVKAEKELSAALQKMKERGIGAFIATYDPVVMNAESIKYIVEFCVQNRIALIVPSKSLLKSGGLLSLEADYVELGKQTGLLANRMLQDAASIEKKSLEIPQKSEIGINLKMAEVLNIRFPESVTSKANYLHR